MQLDSLQRKKIYLKLHERCAQKSSTPNKLMASILFFGRDENSVQAQIGKKASTGNNNPRGINVVEANLASILLYLDSEGFDIDNIERYPSGEIKNLPRNK
jgi:hypothetical protein